MGIKFTPDQRWSSAVWFLSLYTNILGNIIYGKWSSYPLISQPTPSPTPTIPLIYHNFFAKILFHWIFSTWFYIKYWLFWYQICLCCNFFYGYPEFATFQQNYYKKSSNDKIFNLKLKKIKERFLCTRPVFPDYLFASYD